MHGHRHLLQQLGQGWRLQEEPALHAEGVSDIMRPLHANLPGRARRVRQLDRGRLVRREPGLHAQAVPRLLRRLHRAVQGHAQRLPWLGCGRTVLQEPRLHSQDVPCKLPSLRGKHLRRQERDAVRDLGKGRVPRKPDRYDGRLPQDLRAVLGGVLRQGRVVRVLGRRGRMREEPCIDAHALPAVVRNLPGARELRQGRALSLVERDPHLDARSPFGAPR
mmetsp:Transcript_5823/g.12717  ORF Transcript_5823/g.12717 Transcript_5823/m.12717 type:complete len:220 (-) Transcript_5823:642-1301(-)